MALPLITPTSRRPSQAELSRRDRLSARLAELHLIRTVLTDAHDLVSGGWVQNGWFRCSDASGGDLTVGAHDLHLLERHPVTGACLVGAVVHAGGGPAQVHSQLVQRTLDLTWHTLHGDRSLPVRWCPPPAVRIARVRDLTRWNDAAGRTAGDVLGLLADGRRTARHEREHLLA